MSDRPMSPAERIAAEAVLRGSLEERTPIRDIGSEKFCVEAAVLTSLEHELARTAPAVSLSPRWLAWALRRRRGDAATGAFISEAADSVLLDGICTEALWDFSTVDGPSEEARDDAFRRAGLYYSVAIRTKDDALLVDLAGLLARDKKPMMALSIGREIREYVAGTVLGPPAHPTESHACVLAGRVDGAWLLQMPWRRTYGMGGYVLVNDAALTTWEGGAEGFRVFDF